VMSVPAKTKGCTLTTCGIVQRKLCLQDLCSNKYKWHTNFFSSQRCCCCFCCRSLQSLVEIGPHAPAGQTGAKFIIRKDGRRINLAYLRDGASKTLEVRC
jgi:hypothetical protein